MKKLSIVGAGIGGLTAAIGAAEAGWEVHVSEAAARPGGRARTMSGDYRANMGPHALYADGRFWQWLTEHDLLPEIVGPSPETTLIRCAGRLGGWPSQLTDAIKRLPSTAVNSLSFRSWLNRYVDPASAEALIGLVFITVYDHDPGRLSAEFMRERLSRTLAGSARYVVGGWSELVGRLAKRALELGVRIAYRDRTDSVPEGPVILATTLSDARRLTGDEALDWPSGETALLDVGLRSDPGIQWFRVLDLSSRIYMGRYSALDDRIAPRGHDLIQIAAAFHPDEDPAAAHGRAHRLLDVVWPGWFKRVNWQRESVMLRRTGAVDIPGTCWRDRPQVVRSPGHYVVSDQSAAPGMLAEVSASAALQAVAALAMTA